MRFLRFSIFCAAALVVCSCGGNQAVQVDADRVELVKTSVITQQSIVRTLEFSSTLQGYLVQNVAPSVTGVIDHIFVEVGANVKKGDMLVRMDQQQYNTTKLTYANLGIELARVEALKESGSVSEQTYDQTKLSYDQTGVSLNFLEKNTFVKAPFAGVISAKNYEDGELYSGQPILVLTQINTLKALISVPEQYFPQIRTGMVVDIESDIYPGEKFPATIEIVHPTVDASSHTFQVRLKIANGSLRLRPGMYVKATLSMGNAEAIVVPYQAVLKMTGSNDRYVFIAENGVAKRVFVTLGQRFDDMIEVEGDGLEIGSDLVTVGQGKLVDGSKIKIVEEN